MIQVPESRYKKRRDNILRRIQGEALLLVSASNKVKSRDQEFPYQQESNFYYLTGFNEPGAALLLLGNQSKKKSVLFVKKSNPLHEKFEGKKTSLKEASRKFQIDEVYHTEQLALLLPKLISDATCLHTVPGANPDIDSFIWELFKTPIGPRATFPNRLSDARLILAELRSVKDSDEIRCLQTAINATVLAFKKFAPELSKCKSEAHAAKLLETYFTEFGGENTGFDTIVAQGKNATTLHHSPGSTEIRSGKGVLVDAGTTFQKYCADITRFYPVGKKFNQAEADVYDAVRAALKVGVKKSKPGTTLNKIHNSVVASLVENLKSLGILKGKKDNLLKKQSYRPYYMHRTSHFLGLDVHDISKIAETKKSIQSGYNLALTPGNVFTIEPGLYFDSDCKCPELRGTGIRLEEDVLITKSGCRVLSEQLEIEREDVEQLCLG